MIRQRVDIPVADWLVDIFYDVRPSDAECVADSLYRMGCPKKHIRKAYQLVRSGVPNQGLTYSDRQKRHSLIVVGHATDIWEALDTLSHEKQHLEQAICKADGLDPYGERIAYVSGSISEAISRNAWLAMRKIFPFFCNTTLYI